MQHNPLTETRSTQVSTSKQTSAVSNATNGAEKDHKAGSYPILMFPEPCVCIYVVYCVACGLPVKKCLDVDVQPNGSATSIR